MKNITFDITLAQKRSALHYMTGLAKEESDLATHLSEPSHTELLLALNYILDLIIIDILEDIKNGKQ